MPVGFPLCCGLLCGMLALNLAMSVHAEDSGVVTVTVSAPDYDIHEAPVSIVAPHFVSSNVVPADAVPAQRDSVEGGNERLTWIVRDLKRGETRTYHLRVSPGGTPGSGVELKRSGENVDFNVNGKLFTRYDTTTGPNKPYFYPLNGPTGKSVVRHWPVENVAGETQDHPHHRGLWFTHGAMNSVDFWTEGTDKGKTVNTGFLTVESGPVYGLLRAKTDWIAPGDKKIAEDVREVRVYNLSDGYLMDFAITVKAVGGPLLWGDTKEGTFGLRVADSMRAKVENSATAEGHIVNAAGERDAATWGKPADWCDYYGPVDGQTVGVAIFDDPRNPRHPTNWMVRDYGLFAVNPFGLHDYDPKKTPKGAGNLTTPEGETVTFRYRLFFHRGTAGEAHIADVWKTFAQPPAVRVAAEKADN